MSSRIAFFSVHVCACVCSAPDLCVDVCSAPVCLHIYIHTSVYTSPLRASRSLLHMHVYMCIRVCNVHVGMHIIIYVYGHVHTCDTAYAHNHITCVRWVCTQSYHMSDMSDMSTKYRGVVFLLMCVCICIHILTHTHTHTQINMHTHTHIHIDV